MKRFKKWITAGVALSMMAILAGCATTGEGATTATNVTNTSTTTKAMPGSNTASNQTTTTNPSPSTTNTPTNDTVTNTTQMVPTTNTTTSSAGTVPLTLENIQYENNGLFLIMTHGTMTTAYSDPHFTTAATKQFVVTLRHTNPGKYPLNQVQPVNSNWAKNMEITKSGNDLFLTFDLSKTFQSFQSGVAGGFEIEFSFK